MTPEKKQLSTSGMMRNLMRTANIGKFIARNELAANEPSFADLLNSLCEEQEMDAIDVIRLSAIERTYGYQIFRGLRIPSRDKIVQLALALSLSVEQAQALLRAAGKTELYPRIKRDAALIYGINKKMELLAVQELLEELHVTPLSGIESNDR